VIQRVVVTQTKNDIELQLYIEDRVLLAAKLRDIRKAHLSYAPPPPPEIFLPQKGTLEDLRSLGLMILEAVTKAEPYCR